MQKMKHLGDHAPSAEDTAKLNEIVTWFMEHGYDGIMLVHKGDVGVSWVSEPNAEAVRHTLANSIGHIMDESKTVARNLINGILTLAEEIKQAIKNEL